MYKYYVLSLLCLLAFVVQCVFTALSSSLRCSVSDYVLLIVGAGMVPAAFAPIAQSYHVTTQRASYLTTSYTLLGGLTPLLMTPYVNLYGRRPAYLVSQQAHLEGV